MTADLYLALDQGGSQSRALVFDHAGRVVARSAIPVATSHPGEDQVEQDPEELVRSLRRAIRDVVKQLGRRVEHLSSAGLATQRSSVAAWDRATGGALAPILSWQDRRAGARLAGLEAQAEEIRALTGLRLSPHYGATKLAWLLDVVPAVRAAFQESRLAFGPLASFLAFRLLDERPLVVDAANASRTLLLDASSATWSPRLLDLFGVPITALPRVTGTRGELGTLDVGPRKIPLRVLTGDQSAAFFAAGEPSPDVASVTFGTGAFVLRATRGLVPDVPGLLATLVHREDDASTFALEGTVNGAGSALAWAAQDLGVGAADGELERWLAGERDPPLFLNGVGGLAAPYWRTDFRSRFVESGDVDDSARIVAVVESVAFLVAEILRAMEPSQGRPRRVRAGGGLAQLDGLCARLASLAGVPVERQAEAETTALGLARLLGARPTDAAVETFEPRVEHELGARYAAWRDELRRALSGTA